MDLRKNKRYQLKASVTFFWQRSDGTVSRGEGYTRDVSANGVYVLTPDHLSSRTPVRLEIVLPSLREKQSGASLRTQGHVVRSEELGFAAAAADMGFRMRFLESAFGQRSVERGRGKGKCERDQEDTSAGAALSRPHLMSRFWM